MTFAFAGTPQFAARVLRGLDETGRRPALVISQPDRPRGRGLKTCAAPAVLEAERLGLPALQAEDLNAPSVLAHIAESGADTLVVAAFGQLLRAEILERFLCLNVHASLLPSYRGAAPIERALAAGEDVTGVTIMRITQSLDEGPWALQTSLSIGLRDDAASVGRALALLGAQGMDQVLTGLEDGTVHFTPQEGPTNYAAKLCSDDCLLHTDASARCLHDRVRSLSPCVGVRACSGEVGFKIWRTWPYGGPYLDDVPLQAESVAGRAGRLLAVGGRLFLGCADGVVELLLVQPDGKKRMRGADFLRGYGARLGDCVAAPTTAAGPPAG